jgi:Ser/Thr protein kinase RdoA (MazF antagonist)
MDDIIKQAMNESIIEKAEKLFDIKKEELFDLKGFENFVYGYNDKVIRFVHSYHRAYNDVLAEIEFIDYLRKNGASVPQVFLSVNGNISEKIMCDEHHYFTVSLFSKAEGTFVKKEEMNEELFYTLGKNIGLIHKLTKEYQPQHKRYEWYEEDYIGEHSPT